jgi:imidazolonepropionase-like amidohydrolase
MDMLLLEIPDYRYLAYHPGSNFVHTVVKNGETVVSNYKLVIEEEE